MNIVFRELKANLKSFLIWCVIMALLIVLGLAKFSAYYNNPASLEILKSFPKAVSEAMSLQAFNLTTLNGMYGIMFVYFGLLGGIAAAMWGSNMISKEERDKTVEFSLVLPVSRARIITSKAIASLVDCFLFVVVTWVVSAVAVQQYNPDGTFYHFLTLEMVAMFFIELIFLAIGLLLGSSMKRYKRSGSTSVAIILVAYFVSVISGLQAKLDFLKYFTPLKYFDAVKLLNTGRFDVTFLLLSAAIVVGCMTAAYWVYRRRDLYI